jgi:hypothetical protein
VQTLTESVISQRLKASGVHLIVERATTASTSIAYSVGLAESRGVEVAIVKIGNGEGEARAPRAVATLRLFVKPEMDAKKFEGETLGIRSTAGDIGATLLDPATPVLVLTIEE